MLVKPHTIVDERGQPLDTDSELAYVISSIYSELGGDELIRRRRRSWWISGLGLIFSVIMSIVVHPVLLIFLLIPVAALVHAYTSKLKGTIESAVP